MMIDLKVNEEILKLASDNNGVVTTAMISDAGIARANLNALIDKGKLEKTARGVYILPGTWDDEFLNLQSRFKKGIYCNETALFLHDLTDRTPNKFNMTFPENYNLTNAKASGVRAIRTKDVFYTLGITTVTSPAGHKIKTYNAEKTLCDILKPSSKVDIQVITESYKRYAQKKDKNIPQLSTYAKEINVEKRVRSYMEVLI